MIFTNDSRQRTTMKGLSLTALIGIGIQTSDFNYYWSFLASTCDGFDKVDKVELSNGRVY